MPARRGELRGIIPAIVSPCDERDVFLEDRFVALANSLYREGIHGLYVCGATGDGYNLRLEERKRATELAVKVSREFDGLVIVHVGALNSRDAVELAEHAAAAGVDAVASMPPVNRSDGELASYYRDVAHASQIPTLIYHIPQLTGHNLSIPVFCRLLDIPNVVGIKFSGSNLFLMKRLLLARSDIVMFNGNDELLCPALLYGAHGGIGMTYNLFPKFFATLYETVLKGDIHQAMEMQNRFNAFLDRAFTHGLFPVFERILRERGFGSFYFRRPRTDLDETAWQKIRDEIKPYLAAVEEELQVTRK